MPYLPQLATGALAQYPIRKSREIRSAVNRLEDGSERKLLDPYNHIVSWQLAYSGLSAEERVKLEEFFEAVEGRLGTFTFLDPTDNLLLWSERLTNAAWVNGPMLVFSEGVADPSGTNRATRITNSGGTTQAVEQAVEGPASYVYCLSLYARSTMAASVSLVRSSPNATDIANYGLTSAWRRLTHSGGFENSDEIVQFRIQLEAGATIDVFGIQVECQPAASEYKQTTSRSGVYPGARLENDMLRIVAEDVGSHSCELLVTATLAG